MTDDERPFDERVQELRRKAEAGTLTEEDREEINEMTEMFHDALVDLTRSMNEVIRAFVESLDEGEE